jgi:hypothetical protein
MSDTDEYAYKLYAANGDYIEGDTFETKADALGAAQEAMTGGS